MVRAVGVRRFGGVVEVLELPGPRGLRLDEVLVEVRVCGKIWDWANGRDRRTRVRPGWFTGAGA
ncbi:MAG: hypothetical protein ACRDOU_07550 [Streptosporangiaceae bacterium]